MSGAFGFFWKVIAGMAVIALIELIAPSILIYPILVLNIVFE
jgi:hypothetical protein